MAPHTDTLQDDYYAQVKTEQTSDTSVKKPIKLKLKAVVKKPTTTEESISTETPASPAVKSETPKTPSETPVERPKARLVEREHASEGLLRSVMHRGSKSSDTTEIREEKKKPAISFGKAAGGFKPLENRPVMQLPPEERRNSRPPRRDGGSPSQQSQQSGPSRLRDDAKPMFQRDIGYATPSRDGTAKK